MFVTCMVLPSYYILIPVSAPKDVEQKSSRLNSE